MAAQLAILAIRAYKILVSPILTGSCRYTPTCSDYCTEAIRRHGVAAGIWLGLKRIGRCHPFGSAGHDPVPEVVGEAPSGARGPVT